MEELALQERIASQAAGADGKSGQRSGSNSCTYNIVSSVSGSDILSIIRVIDANMKEVDFMFRKFHLRLHW